MNRDHFVGLHNPPPSLGEGVVAQRVMNAFFSENDAGEIPQRPAPPYPSLEGRGIESARNFFTAALTRSQKTETDLDATNF